MVYNRETRKLFPHSTDINFNLTKITKLIIEEITLDERSENLKKWIEFKDLDFEQINSDI